MARVIGKGTVNRRRDLRRQRQFPAYLDDLQVGVLDISLGGVHLYAPESTFGGNAEGLAPGDERELYLPDDNGQWVPYDVTIVRTDPREMGLSVRFTGLTDSQFRLLERIITHGRPPEAWPTPPNFDMPEP